MNEHDIAEQAYKNGYEDGKRDAVKEFADKIFEVFPSDMQFTTISRFLIRTIAKGMGGDGNAGKTD